MASLVDRHDYRYVSCMAETVDIARSLSPRSSFRFVSIASIAALVYAAYGVVSVVAEMISRLVHRGTGIVLTWDPSLAAPQPTQAFYSGGPFIVPGSTPYFTAMTGTVKDVPVEVIVFQSLGDLVSVLTTAGIAICVLVLARMIAGGTPFARVSARALTVLAIVVFVGFEGATVLHGVSAMSVPTVMFAAPQQPDGIYNPPGTTTAFFTFWPVYISAALVALAAVFRAGALYQQDSSGLV